MNVDSVRTYCTHIIYTFQHRRQNQIISLMSFVSKNPFEPLADGFKLVKKKKTKRRNPTKLVAERPSRFMYLDWREKDLLDENGHYKVCNGCKCACDCHACCWNCRCLPSDYCACEELLDREMRAEYE